MAHYSVPNLSLPLTCPFLKSGRLNRVCSPEYAISDRNVVHVKPDEA